MGEAKRRKAEIQKLKRDLPPKSALQVTAVHESGHAVARYLTAPDFGYALEEAITYIEVHDASHQPSSPSFDRTMCLRSQAVTYGPMFSKQIAVASIHVHEARKGQSLSGTAANEYLKEIIAVARAAGADIDKSFQVKAIIAVSGAVAEARFTRRSVDEVWNGYECENDLMEIVRDGVVCGYKSERIEAVIDWAIEQSEEIFARTDVWRAVLSLAARLPSSGRIEGTEVAVIVSPTLNATP